MSVGGGGGGLGSQYYSLRWNNHPVNLVSVFTGLYQAESLVDVTLAAGGRHLQAHKVVLSACSEYFQSVFAANPCQHPVVILKDVAFDDLETVVKFMYHGIVNVSSDKLPAVLNTADALQIKGLEKTNELMAPYLASASSGSSSRPSHNLLSVPGQTRQPSTDSVPEYLQRSRSDAGYYPHRAHSAESRGYSFESRLEVARPKRMLTPPLSTSLSADQVGGNFARKKFRNRSEHSSSLSTSVEQSREESPTPATPGSGSGNRLELTPTIGPAPALSPRPESDSSSGTEHIAKKKRAMFSANKGSSSCGSRSSDVQNSNNSDTAVGIKLRSIQSLSSSGKSHSHSSDREEAASDAGQSGSAASGGAGQLSVPRPVMRSASAEDITSHSALSLSTKFKRERFLKRQQCQEAAEAEEVSTAADQGAAPSDPPPPAPATPPPSQASQPTQKIVKQVSHPRLSPSSQLKEEPQETAECSVSVSSTPARQPSLDPLCGLESVPLLYSSSGPRLSPPNLFRPVLPTVRIIPDTEPSVPTDRADTAQSQSISGHHLSPVSSAPQLYHGHHPQPALLHPEMSPYDHHPHHSPHPYHLDKKPLHLLPRMNDNEAADIHISSNNTPPPPPQHYHNYPPRHHLDPCDSPGPHGGGHGHSPPGPFNRTNVPHHRQYDHTPPRPTDVSMSTNKQPLGQFGHCPKARDGPALSCNFCWNTTDGSGRILRRKTKYHCPECQTNLCIVPCFQQYHEAMENENTEMR